MAAAAAVVRNEKRREKIYISRHICKLKINVYNRARKLYKHALSKKEGKKERHENRKKFFFFLKLKKRNRHCIALWSDKT